MPGLGRRAATGVPQDGPTSWASSSRPKARPQLSCLGVGPAPSSPRHRASALVGRPEELVPVARSEQGQPCEQVAPKAPSWARRGGGELEQHELRGAQPCKGPGAQDCPLSCQVPELAARSPPGHASTVGAVDSAFRGNVAAECQGPLHVPARCPFLAGEGLSIFFLALSWLPGSSGSSQRLRSADPRSLGSGVFLLLTQINSVKKLYFFST